MPGYIKKLPAFYYWASMVALVSNIVSLLHQDGVVKLVGNLTFVLPFLGFAILWRLNNARPELFSSKQSLFQVDDEAWGKLSKYLPLHLLLIFMSGYFIQELKSLDQFILSGAFYSFFGFWGSMNCYFVFKSLVKRAEMESQ